MTSLLTKSCITKLFQTEITSSPTLVTLSDLSRCMIASSKNWNFTSVLSCKKMFFSLLEYILLKINEEKKKKKATVFTGSDTSRIWIQIRSIMMHPQHSLLV